MATSNNEKELGNDKSHWAKQIHDFIQGNKQK